MAAEVYLNRKFIGNVESANGFIENFKDQRRKGQIAEEAGIFYDEIAEEIHINSQKGRALRPLIVIKEGTPLLTEKHLEQLKAGEITWDDLVHSGVVEYLDAAEEENALVAYKGEFLTKDHTHLEVSQGSIVSITTSLVPFGNFNPSSRLIIGSKNQKQAVGYYAANYHIRMDMDSNLMHYPQFPLVKTKIHSISNYDEHPAGQNVVVAVMSYKGYNMEDGVILNKSSVERGMARSTYFKPISAELLRYSGGLTDELEIPDKETKGYRTEKQYTSLEADGIVHTEAKLTNSDVIIGRTSPPRFLNSLDEYNLSAGVRRESSVALKHGESGIADFVTLTESSEGNRLIQVRLREERIPEIGDKFTSRHGQKGVVGVLVPSQDLPFTNSGVIPDLIFTPHGVSSRMTVSHLLELLGSKVSALSGRLVDATLFDSEKETDLRKELANLGFQENATEVMYDGITGKKMVARIYIGNMYYLRLKHMVSKKIQSRARGPIQLLTRQPTEGKAREGGLRLGEMEKDTFIAHGATLLLKERFDSDKTAIPVCTKSGLIGFYDGRSKTLKSPIYGEDSDMAYVEMSYAFKLLLNELMSLGIYPKIKLIDKF
ncbi:DNA-directed RNA polymerase subunit B [archaeon]|jgi:DNA-directed RNA polymerase subunit B'|nr:DNA-directed RNA polymerase subunit B [archaeon]MBT6697464.1 DNA-directed RNA polymerase subunit B [archaeon]